MLRRILDVALNVFLILFAVALLTSGSPGPLVIAGAIALALGWLLRVVAWFANRRDPGSHRHDPRREIVLSASLVGRVRSLQRQDRRGEAAKLLQGETDLSLGDTARALKLVRETSQDLSQP